MANRIVHTSFGCKIVNEIEHEHPVSVSGVFERQVGESIGHIIVKIDQRLSVNDYANQIEFRTIRVLICDEVVRTVYVLDSFYLCKDGEINLGTLGFLQRVVFPTYLVKHFDKDAYIDDCECALMALTATVQDALSSCFKEADDLIIDNICQGTFYDWMQLDNFKETIDLFNTEFDSHFVDDVDTRYCFRRTLADDSTLEDRAFAFYNDFFIGNWRLAGLYRFKKEGSMATEREFRHESSVYTVTKLTFTRSC